MATLGESPNGLSAATRGLARAVAELQRCRG